MVTGWRLLKARPIVSLRLNAGRAKHQSWYCVGLVANSTF